jgi:arsenate reductase
MAEAFLRTIGGEAFDVSSAGTHPKGINPLTVRVLLETGIDDPRLRSKSVGDYLDQEFDDVITVCDQAREVCPVFPGGARRLHWSFDDPAAAEGSDGERIAEFRRVRDEIEARVRAYVAEPVAVGNP